jgi:hypothetical protein
MGRIDTYERAHTQTKHYNIHPTPPDDGNHVNMPPRGKAWEPPTRVQLCHIHK